jgi:hypothetical protein
MTISAAHSASIRLLPREFLWPFYLRRHCKRYWPIKAEDALHAFAMPVTESRTQLVGSQATLDASLPAEGRSERCQELRLECGMPQTHGMADRSNRHIGSELYLRSGSSATMSVATYSTQGWHDGRTLSE